MNEMLWEGSKRAVLGPEERKKVFGAKGRFFHKKEGGGRIYSFIFRKLDNYIIKQLDLY